MAASRKKSFVLRLDEGTYKALERWAADEFRSVNGQLEWVIAQALKDHGRVKPQADQAAADDDSSA